MKFYRYLSLLLLATTTLSAALQDHFKPCPGKSDIHKMRNIDFIYMINLDQRPEKFQSCADQLAIHGIYPYRFSAVNGWELSFETINDIGIKYQPWMAPDVMGTFYIPENNGAPEHAMINRTDRTFFSHCMGRGTIGIVLSHLSVLQDAFDSGYETIWVMEDDIEVIRNPHIISDLIDALDNQVGHDGWDILFTDQDTKNNQGNYVPCTSFARRPNFNPWNPSRFAQRQDISEDFRRIGARYGAYSMIIRRSGMEKILDFLKIYSVFLPYDMEFYLNDEMRMYNIRGDVVSTQVNALSDNGAPNYKDKK